MPLSFDFAQDFGLIHNVRPQSDLVWRRGGQELPLISPPNDKIMASTINWVKTTFGGAPNAFLSPISLVRSVTVTSIIFIMPIPPTSKEMAAIPAGKQGQYLGQLILMGASQHRACKLTHKLADHRSIIVCLSYGYLIFL